MTDISVAGNGMEAFQSADVFVLTGDNTQFVLWKGGENSVFAEGTNQTLNEEYAAPNIVYDLGKNLNITFTPEAEQEPAMTVYDFQIDKSAHVTLSAALGQTATESRYSVGHEWGTRLTVTSAVGATNTAYFAYDPHVAVVQGS